MIYMFCYDISDEKRLRKIAKKLQDYGLRIQKSFFQANVDERTKEIIKKEIIKIIDLKKDSFFIYPICYNCSKNTMKDGTGILLNLENYEIL